MTALKFNKVKDLPTSGYNVGDVFFVSNEKKIYIRTASGWESYNNEDAIAASLQAVQIYTDNTPEHMQANKANIAAYNANLQALGVNVENGYNIPVSCADYNMCGCMWFGKNNHSVYMGILTVPQNLATSISNPGVRIFSINKSSGQCNVVYIPTDNVATTSKNGLMSANDKSKLDGINALIENKQDKLVSGTNIKTINGESLLGSGGVTTVMSINPGISSITEKNNISIIQNALAGVMNAYITYYDGTRLYTLYGGNQGAYMKFVAFDNSKEYILTLPYTISGTGAPSDPMILNINHDAKTIQEVSISGGSGGSTPVFIDLDNIPTTTGSIVSDDLFDTIADAAMNNVAVFGYTKNENDTISSYNVVPLSVKYAQATLSIILIEYLSANKHYHINMRSTSDGQHQISSYTSHPFTSDTTVSSSSKNHVASQAVWKEIHAEPMTVNSNTSGVTSLSSTDKHKILCYATSGTRQYNLPTNPIDGETFVFLKVTTGHSITITGNSNILDCSTGNSVTAKTIGSSTRRRITITYSSTASKWILMADDFLS